MRRLGIDRPYLEKLRVDQPPPRLRRHGPVDAVQKKPRPERFRAGFRRRLTDSFAPATLADLTRLPAGFPARRVLCSNRRARNAKTPLGQTQWGFSSGDVLLSRGLSPHYHRGCSVSLPCSEWERVVPLRYYHQRSEPDWGFAAPQRRQRESASLMTMSIVQFQKNCWFSDIYIQEAKANV